MKRRLPLMLTFALAACVLSKQQSMDLDATHWISYTFSEANATVHVQVPPGFLVLPTSRLPEMSYDKRSQRLLLKAMYDLGIHPYSDLAEFEIEANFIRLGTPINAASAILSDVDDALHLVFGKPINADNSPKPTIKAIQRRAWISYDNSADVTYGQTRETYGTVVHGTTVLLITGWYGENIRKDANWFNSRRQILRSVPDHVVITLQ